MLKIAFLLNANSGTSVPSKWASLLNKRKDCECHVFTFKNVHQIFHRIWSLNVFHGHHVKISATIFPFSYILKKVNIFTVHGSLLYLSPINKAFLFWVFAFSHQVVFVNSELYTQLPFIFKRLIGRNYKIILNGVFIPSKFGKNNIHERYNIPLQKRLIYHPARFVVEKNQERLIRAFAQHCEVDGSLVLVMSGDGPLKEMLRSLARELRVSDKIIFTGLVPSEDVFAILDVCDTFAMPSLSEGLNVAFLEALHLGKKILVSNINQYTGPFEHWGIEPSSVNTHFCDPNDVKSISEALGFVLGSNGLQTSSQIRQVISIGTMLDSYIKVYEQPY